MKIRTLDELDDRIREELTWRKHEIQFFDQHIIRATEIAQRSLLRASVALLYAHWEGFVKSACHFYLCYVASLKLTTGELSAEFAAFSLNVALHRASEAKASSVHISLVEEFRSSINQRAKVPTNPDAIQTKSNLSFPVLSNVLVSIGIDPEIYSDSADLINIQLVESRNKVAHGQKDYIHRTEWEDLRSAIIGIMESIHTEIVNNAAQGKFRHLTT